MHRAIAAVLLLAAAAIAQEEPPPGPGDAKAVTIPTKDGVVLSADWYPAAPGMPGIVALATPGAERATWKPLAIVRPEGWGLLVVETKGEIPPPPPPPPPGKPAPRPPAKGKGKPAPPPPLPVRQAKEAAEAAAWLRTEGKCDGARVGFAAAGSGAIGALEAAVADGKAAAVLVLTPEFAEKGFSPDDRAKPWSAFPVLAASTEEDAEAGARILAGAVASNADSGARVVPGKGLRGTSLLPGPDGLARPAVAWLRIHLGRQILDGVVDPAESASAIAEDLPRGIVSQGKGSVVRVRLDARYINLSAAPPPPASCPPKILVTYVVLREDKGVPVERRLDLSGEASEDGTYNRAFLVGDLDGGTGGSKGSLPGTAMVKNGVLEARIPWAVLGVTPETGASITIRTDVEKTPTSVLFQGVYGGGRR